MPPPAYIFLTILNRGASLTRKRTPLGPYRRPMPRVLGGSSGGSRFLMGEVPLYAEVDWILVVHTHAPIASKAGLSHATPNISPSRLLPIPHMSATGVPRFDYRGALLYIHPEYSRDDGPRRARLTPNPVGLQGYLTYKKTHPPRTLP